jgi:phosphoribosylformylglycinamidine synthase
LLGARTATLGASEYLARAHDRIAGAPPHIDLAVEASVQRLAHQLIQRGLVSAAHDTSEGGLLTALAEMLIAGETGARVSFTELLDANGGRLDKVMFGEAASRIIVSVAREHVDSVLEMATAAGVDSLRLGECRGAALIVVGVGEVEVAALTATWSSGLA